MRSITRREARTAFGVEVVKAVNSPRVKLLFDAYHMQIMEGDLIRTIRANKEYVAHFHDPPTSLREAVVLCDV